MLFYEMFSSSLAFTQELAIRYACYLENFLAEIFLISSLEGVFCTTDAHEITHIEFTMCRHVASRIIGACAFGEVCPCSRGIVDVNISRAHPRTTV